MRKKLIVFTGAGISAESGLKTFRDHDGLWEGHRVTDVATPGAWAKNPRLVLEFYNQRRRSLKEASPNAAHLELIELEKNYDVTVITQNVDDLHERAGSRRIIHLHGELTKARSSIDETYVVHIGYRNLNLGEKCPRGSQLRPHIVWFEERVPRMAEAMEEVTKADVFVVVGTSLVVYPAAELLYYAPPNVPVYIVNREKPAVKALPNIRFIIENATSGVAKLVEELANAG